MTKKTLSELHRTFIGIPSDLMRRVSAVVLAMFIATPVLAQDGTDMVAAMSGICVTALETGAAVGPGLTRAPPAMEAKLLNGKIAKVWRTWNDKVVIVAHASGRTCEVMGLGIGAVEYHGALEAWLKDNGSHFMINPEANFAPDKPGGAYVATALDDGGFIQMFIQSHPQAKFIGATIARVEDSTEARDLLGL